MINLESHQQIRLDILGWVLNVFLVDLLHDLQILFTLSSSLVVMSRTSQSKDLALLLDADLAFRGN